VKEILTYNHNLSEVSNYSFVGEELLHRLEMNEDRELRLRNPLSKEHDRLRRSLVPNLVKNVSLNQRHCEAFGIYELGRVYLKEKRESPDLAAENTRVCGALYDRLTEKPLFYAAKGVAADLLGQLLVKDAQYVPLQGSPPPCVHPARSLEIFIGSKPAGMVFELHPRTKEAFDIRGCVALFDLDADLLFTSPRLEQVFRDLQKFPDAPFEISILADKYTNARDILRIIRESGGEHVREAEVIAVYEGSPIPEGKKSVSFKVIFAAAERTLGPEEIEKLQAGVIAGLGAGGFSLR
jgi:phenylalanyl-tRNA synthetase beta chain